MLGNHLCRIEEAIGRIEMHEGVAVPFAAGTGSRIDGTFRSVSDYDVSGFFVRPLRSYLSLKVRSDAIRSDPGGAINTALVDVRRFVRWTAQGSPSALDVLLSPVMHRVFPGVRDMLLRLHEETFSAERTAPYFRSIAFSAFSGAVKRERLAQGEEIGYAIRCIGRHAHVVRTGLYPRLGSDMILDEASADDLRRIDERREAPVSDLVGERFDAVVSRIGDFLRAHAERTDANAVQDLPDMADDVLFAIVSGGDALVTERVPPI